MESNNEPCLIPARQGNTVQFQSKFLYSKYDPSKTIISDISNRQFLPGTLVLCFSPCLFYGIDELMEKLPENCVALGIECDKTLHEFTKKFADEARRKTKVYANDDTQNKSTLKQFIYVPYEDIVHIPELLNTRNAHFSDGTSLPEKGVLRRCVAINFSAGVSFHADFYASLEFSCSNAISLFWKNRMTLTKFGRKYSRNLIRNLATHALFGISFKKLYNTVTKPILVCGAGESVENTAKKLLCARNDFYVIAADAAFATLTAFGIVPDAVVCEEAQVAIAPAFIGFKNIENMADKRSVTVFAGISSWHGIYQEIGKNARLAYFSTKYDDTKFFSSLAETDFFPPEMQPLGSVGLTATEIALRLRKNDDVPIFISGLDFSYSIGKTHAKNAPAHIRSLFSANRITPIENYNAAFGLGCEIFQTENTEKSGNSGKKFATSVALKGYAEIFSRFFYGRKNLFDCRETGLSLRLEKKDLDGEKDFFTAEEKDRKNALPNLSANDKSENGEENLKTEICHWLKNEISALENLREILIGKTKIPADNINNEIMKILDCREYLYLHFPDGFLAQTNPSFLKRVRAEIDFFIKDLSVSLEKACGSENCKSC